MNSKLSNTWCNGKVQQKRMLLGKMRHLQSQFPYFSLEDKVDFQGAGNDRTMDVGPVRKSNRDLFMNINHERPSV